MSWSGQQQFWGAECPDGKAAAEDSCSKLVLKPSELQQVPRGQTVTADYRVSEVLEKTAATTLERKKEMGHQTKSNSHHTCRGTLPSNTELHLIAARKTCKDLLEGRKICKSEIDLKYMISLKRKKL